MRRHILVFILFSLIIIAGCSSSQLGWKAEDGSSDKQSAQKGMIEDFDPLTLEDDDIRVTPTRSQSPNEPVQNDIPILRESESQTSSQDLVQGFRVQLLATGDEVQAREAQRNAIFRFEEDVYLVFEPPLYKLRIGDCSTRKDAESLKEKAHSNGFRDAWVVPSKIDPRKAGL